MSKFRIGIDEVGRGPLAGPVAVGAVFSCPAMLARFGGVRDSKQLSRTAREAWYARMRAARGDDFRFAVSFASASTIDRIGIVPAIRRALAASLEKIGADPATVKVLLDGGLRAPDIYGAQETIVKGDEKEPLIALASIAAKVLRDRRMMHLAERYPEYGFDHHVGYGTAAHIAAIRKYGLTPAHRKDFCGNLAFSNESRIGCGA